MAIEHIQLIESVQIFKDVILKCELIIGLSGPDEAQYFIGLENVNSGERMELSKLFSKIEAFKELLELE